ncbi:hypothetical protein JVT61DRAFT_399 [Boletus reticuloceps]|uniref:Uncharacterized protein n=1 Tax=Boletus reticuloceps TaxID=495285 RepID=A0A8I2Z0I0_9AGAM|nr:hypothetical protein JVT61DRAFT_399 [Boletus reticuloceps]
MIPLCSVYCNTLLANLNARAYVLGAGETQNVDLDLLVGHSSWVSGGSEGDKQGGRAGITFAANQATEMTTLSDADRSTQPVV